MIAKKTLSMERIYKKQNINACPNNVSPAGGHITNQLGAWQAICHNLKKTRVLVSPLPGKSIGYPTPLYRPVCEDFPHTGPMFKSFLPAYQPNRRHPVWRITLLPLRHKILWTIPGNGSGYVVCKSSNITSLLGILFVLYPAINNPRYNCTNYWRDPKQP